jgi:hypothetical protein
MSVNHSHTPPAHDVVYGEQTLVFNQLTTVAPNLVITPMQDLVPPMPGLGRDISVVAQPSFEALTLTSSATPGANQAVTRAFMEAAIVDSDIGMNPTFATVNLTDAAEPGPTYAITRAFMEAYVGDAIADAAVGMNPTFDSVTLNNPPTGANSATTKSYVDAAATYTAGTNVALAGKTISTIATPVFDSVTLNSAPSAASSATTKAYVDTASTYTSGTNIAVAGKVVSTVTAPTFTSVTLGQEPTLAAQAANKGYVDRTLGTRAVWLEQFLTADGGSLAAKTFIVAAGNFVWIGRQSFNAQTNFQFNGGSVPTDIVQGISDWMIANSLPVYVRITTPNYPQRSTVWMLTAPTNTSNPNGIRFTYSGDAFTSTYVDDPNYHYILEFSATNFNYVGGTGVTVTGRTIATVQNIATTATPTFNQVAITAAPVNTTDAATKAYVDANALNPTYHPGGGNGFSTQVHLYAYEGTTTTLVASNIAYNCNCALLTPDTLFVMMDVRTTVSSGTISALSATAQGNPILVSIPLRARTTTLSSGAEVWRGVAGACYGGIWGNRIIESISVFNSQANFDATLAQKYVRLLGPYIIASGDPDYIKASDLSGKTIAFQATFIYKLSTPLTVNTFP